MRRVRIIQRTVKKNRTGAAKQTGQERTTTSSLSATRRLSATSLVAETAVNTESGTGKSACPPSWSAHKPQQDRHPPLSHAKLAVRTVAFPRLPADHHRRTAGMESCPALSPWTGVSRAASSLPSAFALAWRADAPRWSACPPVAFLTTVPGPSSSAAAAVAAVLATRLPTERETLSVDGQSANALVLDVGFLEGRPPAHRARCRKGAQVPAAAGKRGLMLCSGCLTLSGLSVPAAPPRRVKARTNRVVARPTLHQPQLSKAPHPY